MRIAALLVSAVFALLPSIAGAQTLPVVRVTTTFIDSGAEVFYAEDMGFFKKAGIDVDIIPGKNGAAMAAAVASGAADIGYSDVPALSKAYSNGIVFKLVAPAALWTDAAPVNQVMVGTTSTIKDAKDLDGKVFGVPGLGTGAEYTPKMWIDKSGGDSTTVKFIEIPYAAMPAALEAGRIDAAYVAEPFLALAKQHGRFLAYADDAVAKESLRTGWFTTDAWAKANPELVARFASAIHAAAVWANDPKNQAQSAAILVKYTKIDPSLVAGMIRARYGTALTTALVQPQIDLSAKYANFAPFPAKDIIAGP